MSIARKLVKFVAENLAAGALTQIGEHVGDAIGTVLGRKIDPEHAKQPSDEGPPPAHRRRPRPPV